MQRLDVSSSAPILHPSVAWFENDAIPFSHLVEIMQQPSPVDLSKFIMGITRIGH
jgi:hypothetical protein